jgi:hypothetical protein
VLLSSIYVAAAAGNRHLCEKVEHRRKERGMKRQLDYTRISELPDVVPLKRWP